MITYSIIQKSQLEGAHRLDAEYYQPEFLEVNKHLLSIPHLILGEHAFITDGEHGSVEFVEQGIKYLTAENIQEGFINTSEPRFVSELVDTRNKRASLLSDDVVISIKGTVGLAAITVKEDLPANMNRDVSRIHIKDSINPFYLVTFLNSKFGRGQTLRESSGNVQQMTTLGRIRELVIPIISDDDSKKVEKLVENSRNELKNSEILYQQAEDLLLEELGLRDFQIEDDLSFVVNLSDVKKAKRVDADFFQPEYEALISHFKKLTQPLKEMVFRGTTVLKIDPEIEYKYIEISDINTGNGEITANIVKGRDLPANAKMKLNGGELLISKVRPTRGAVAIVPDGWKKNYVASGAFSIFKTESPKREYLQVVMRSIVGKLQLEKPTTGTSYPTITDEDVENVLIPILPKPTQQKIADLVRKSHEAGKKSKELLEEAKRKVEEMIEKGDKG